MKRRYKQYLINKNEEYNDGTLMSLRDSHARLVAEAIVFVIGNASLATVGVLIGLAIR